GVPMNEPLGETGLLLPDSQTLSAMPEPPVATVAPRARVKPVNRNQTMMRVVDVEQLIEEDHPARAIWAFVGKLDLGPFEEPIEAVEGVAGRPVWNRQLLVSLWILCLQSWDWFGRG